MNRPISWPTPPLEPGDQLPRTEFERRYENMPTLKKAELIEGVVYMPAPVRWRNHGSPHADLMGIVFHYRVATPGVSLGDNASVRMDLDNEPQPDGTLIVEPECGGRVKLREDDFVEGGPELVLEIAASSVSIDLNKKFQTYRRNGVLEYLIWRVQDEAVDWFALWGEQYEMLPCANGIYRSEIFPGLWLDVRALLQGDLVQALQTLQRGIATPEHAAFVNRLAEVRGRGSSS